MEATTERKSKKDKKSKSNGNEEHALPQVEAAEAEPSEGEGHGKVKFKGSMQHDEAVHYLEAILNGLRKGTLQFKQGEERVALTPSAATVRVEVKAERKDDKEKLSLELSWHTGPEEAEEKLEVD